MAVHISNLGLNCQKCSKEEKKYRGCTEKGTHPYFFEINGESIKLSRCPLKLVHPVMFEHLQWYSYYKKGHLPFNKSIGEHPAKLLEIFDIIDNELQIIEKEKHGRRTKS